MRTNASISWSLGVAAALVVTAVPLHAQRELLRWSGRVDQEVQLVVSGQTVTTSRLGPSERGENRLNVMTALPRRDGMVTVQMLDGRGVADVIRQPTAENGYTAVIRIRDPKGGSGTYRLEADWQPVAAGELGPPFNRDRDLDRDHDRDRDVTGAEGRLALVWSADVDNDVEITLSQRGVSYNTMRGRDPQEVESSFKGLPSDVTSIRVIQQSGRNPIVVTQQPSPDNGYTAILRIHDPEPGFEHYGFDVVWR